MKPSLKAALEILRYDGPHYLAWRVLTRAMSPIGDMSIEILFAMDLSAERPYRPPRIPMELSLAREEEIVPMLKQLTARDFEQGFEDLTALYVSRIRRGEQCWVARVGETVVHVNWTCFGWAESLPDFPLRLKAGEICTTDAHTPAAWRGKGLHEYVLNEMLRAARSRGIRRAYTTTDLYNRRSRKALQRLGWRQEGAVFYFYAARWRKLVLLPLGGNVEPLFRAGPEIRPA